MRRTLVALWLACGVVYATTTLASELLWRVGYAIATNVRGERGEEVTQKLTDAINRGRAYAAWSAWLAPTVWWLRSTPSQIAIQNPFIPDDEAIDAIESELRYDRYNTELFLILALRYRHAGQLEKARETHERVKKIWPGSPLDQAMTTLIYLPTN